MHGGFASGQIAGTVSFRANSVFKNVTFLPLHYTRLVFPFPVIPCDDQTSDFCHTITLGRYDKMPSANIQHTHLVVGEIHYLGVKFVAPAIGHGRIPPPSLSFPPERIEELWLVGLKGLSPSGSLSAAPVTPVAEGPTAPLAGVQLGPNPAVRDGATPHFSPPSLPVPLARGTRRGNSCQVRRRCRPG